MEVKVDAERCKGCGYCVEACPKEGVLRMGSDLNSRGNYYVVVSDLEKCIGCGLCYRMCPDVVLEIRKVLK